MTLDLYVMYDKVAKNAGNVFQAGNDNVAVRNVMQYLDKSGFVPDHYKLYRLGSFDSSGMNLTVEETPVEVPIKSMDQLMAEL